MFMLYWETSDGRKMEYCNLGSELVQNTILMDCVKEPLLDPSTIDISVGDCYYDAIEVRHKATKYHDLAMELAGCAMVLKHIGLTDKAQAVSHYASVLESRAAHYANGYTLSQGVLYRSAAWLAYHGGDSERAISYAHCGLNIEGVPEEIREELREVLEVAKGG